MSPVARTKVGSSFLSMAGLIALLLGLLFYRSFLPSEVHFSNDGPLGGLVEEQNQLPQTFTGAWTDLNSIGSGGGAAAPALSSLLRMVIGPVGFAKFFPPCALFILGLGVWAFLRSLRLSPLAVTLGTLAAVLNSGFFSGACWGIASVEIAFGLDFLALALVLGNPNEPSRMVRWSRLGLAGLCVGINVTEAADVGALSSMLVAIFVFYKSLTEAEGTWPTKTARGLGRVLVVGLFAGFIAFQTVSGLISTQIQGVAGTAQDAGTKAQHWDFATQWSLPKVETLGLVVPGLFGYKMDTPKDMIPALQEPYRGGAYWGGVGRDPALDRFIDNGRQGTAPSGFMRFTGGGNYCGILVALIALWAIAQSFRRKHSPFTNVQKMLIWFWTASLVVCLLLAWGRFAPFFYGLLYQLPYFSTIRNPAKFLFFFSWSLIILFAYGVHALSRQLAPDKPKSTNGATPFNSWWARADQFDRRWLFACIGILGASVLGWLIFAGQKPSLIQYLQKMGFPDETTARDIAEFSLGQAGWLLILFATAIVLLTLTIAGYFSGPRARMGTLLLGAFLVFDLGRADLPFIVHWDYKQKYEVGSLNPIVDFLRNKPYEHRVAGLPFRAPQGLELFDELYRIEWMQQHFPYYNVQCLDIIQMPRMAENLKAYLETFAPRGTAESAALIAREWQLTNTRYLLGAAGYLDVLNQQLDPGQHRFRILQRFEVVPKPGILQPQRLEELTAVPDQNGRYALFDFTGVLPRAKLYANWRVSTNDDANLKTLADSNFDPEKTVLISTPQKDLPAVATNENNGTVEFKSYSPKQIVFTASTTAPSVLLLNDKYDPNWRVTVDGDPAALLRCNYIMRGVALPAGAHTVEFQFLLPNQPLYITLAAIGTGLVLLGLLIFLPGRKPAVQP